MSIEVAAFTVSEKSININCFNIRIFEVQATKAATSWESSVYKWFTRVYSFIKSIEPFIPYNFNFASVVIIAHLKIRWKKTSSKIPTHDFWSVKPFLRPIKLHETVPPANQMAQNCCFNQSNCMKLFFHGRKKDKSIIIWMNFFPNCWEIFHIIFLSSADIFQNQFFRKIIPGIPSECQTVCIQNVGPSLGPNCLQRLSADDKS